MHIQAALGLVPMACPHPGRNLHLTKEGGENGTDWVKNARVPLFFPKIQLFFKHKYFSDYCILWSISRSLSDCFYQFFSTFILFKGGRICQLSCSHSHKKLTALTKIYFSTECSQSLTEIFKWFLYNITGAIHTGNSIKTQLDKAFIFFLCFYFLFIH